MDDAEHLKAWLAQREVPCPVCGHTLHGLGTPVCPECSAPLRLALASASLGKGPWIVAMSSMALALGIDVLVSGVIGLGVILRPLPPTPAAWVMLPVLLLVFLVLTALAASGLLVAYRTRRRWASWTRERQWGMAVAALLVVSCGHSLIGAIVARCW